MDLSSTSRPCEQLLPRHAPIIRVRSTGERRRPAGENEVIHEEPLVEQVQQVDSNVPHRGGGTACVEEGHVQHGHLVTRVLPTHTHGHLLVTSRGTACVEEGHVQH